MQYIFAVTSGSDYILIIIVEHTLLFFETPCHGLKISLGWLDFRSFGWMVGGSTHCSVFTIRQSSVRHRERNQMREVLGDTEVTANLYCNIPYPYWESCVDLQYI